MEWCCTAASSPGMTMDPHRRPTVPHPLPTPTCIMPATSHFPIPKHWASSDVQHGLAWPTCGSQNRAVRNAHPPPLPLVRGGYHGPWLKVPMRLCTPAKTHTGNRDMQDTTEGRSCKPSNSHFSTKPSADNSRATCGSTWGNKDVPYLCTVPANG